MLICTKIQLHPPLASFLRYYIDFANLLFWVIWACLAMPTKINQINLWESLMFICMQKKLHPALLLLRYCKDIKLAILGTLGISSHDQLN